MTGNEKGLFVFNIAKGLKNSLKPFRTKVLFYLVIMNRELSILVTHQGSAWSTRVVAIDAHPARFELGLNHFQTF